jgi:hypothetical protein
LGNTENFLIFGNGETQIMDGMNKFYFGSCENVQNAAGNPVYATNYMGFNAIYDGTNWNCATNGWNNGGAVIWSTVGGDICFSNFETNSFQPQGNQNASIASSELVENRTLMIHKHGSVSIGGYHTGSGNYKLAVHGTIAAWKIIVNEKNWYDHVFEEDYKLMSIENLNSYIKENKHLPEIPTQEDVNNDGVDLGEMNAKLLLKVEELTLYIIQLNEQMKAMQKEIHHLKEEKK